jgi:hypothetical protein
MVEPAFYYWKSVFNLTPFEKKRLDTLLIKTLYIKFFDVDWDDVLQQPMPKAVIGFADTSFRDFMIIPTVFITNECIQKLDSSGVNTLAHKVEHLIKEINTKNNCPESREIQIDCDWTAGTKDVYFYFLNAIKKLFPQTLISATIRLHQIKFLSRSGIPPADKGLLMCYNMGNLKNPSTKNSIIEEAEFKKYIANLGDYPLPLDIAFPLFEWKVLFRNNQYKGLIQHLPDSIFNKALFKINGNRFEILRDSVLSGYDLKKGDLIRKEESSYREIMNVSGIINGSLKNTQPRVSLYHLDSITLNKFTTHELESIYNSLR